MIVATFVVLILFVLNDKKKVTYKVSFDTEGGTLVATQSVEEGEKARKPEDPTKEGYIFKGWMLNDKEYNFDTKVEKNIELKAKWEKVVKLENNTNNNNNNNNTQNNNSNNNTGNNNAQNNNNNKPTTPKLTNMTLTACGTGTYCENFTPTLTDGKYIYDLTINKDDYRKNIGYSVSGYVIYEKTGSEYKKIEEHLMTGYDAVAVYISPGEKKEFVAQVYAIDSNNKKHYSDYSNVVVIDHSS